MENSNQSSLYRVGSITAKIQIPASEDVSGSRALLGIKKKKVEGGDYSLEKDVLQYSIETKNFEPSDSKVYLTCTSNTLSLMLIPPGKNITTTTIFKPIVKQDLLNTNQEYGMLSSPIPETRA